MTCLITLFSLIVVGLVLQFIAWRRRGYRIGRVFRFALGMLWFTSTVLTGGSLILAAALKTETLASEILAYDPRYMLASAGVETLRDMHYPLSRIDPKTNKTSTVNIGILNIDNPSWPVTLEFVRSEIAIRKSQRGVPIAGQNDAGPPKKSRLPQCQ